jgi:tetratricopeptide (TPR) repeat protein
MNRIGHRAFVLIGGLALNATLHAQADQQTYNDYSQARAACERALATNASDMETVCRKAAEAGDRLTPSRLLERAHAFLLHGRSLAATGQNAEALKRFEQAVAARRQGLRSEGVREDSDADLATSMAFIAETHIRLKNPKAADDHYSAAIATFERAIVAVPELRAAYSRRLTIVLRRAAELKRALGQNAEALSLEAKAERLSPN